MSDAMHRRTIAVLLLRVVTSRALILSPASQPQDRPGIWERIEQETLESF